MSQELVDLRTKITPETHAVLEAESQATGKGHCELSREVLHEWALLKIHAASILGRQLAAKGLRGIDGGMAGNRRESQGS